MRRGRFAHDALQLALSAAEPGVKDAERVFALGVALDLLPRLSELEVLDVLPRLMALARLVEPWRRPTRRLQQALERRRGEGDALRRILDELVSTGSTERRALRGRRESA